MPNALTWRPTIPLPGAHIRVADVTEHLRAHESWRATLGGHLYVLAGTGTEPASRERITAYAGISEAETSGRPWASLTHWVRTAAALDVDTIALVTWNQPPDPDALRVVECAVIRQLNGSAFMLNTVTGAAAPHRALGQAARAHAAFGEFLATVLRHHVLRGRRNPPLTPASTLRETAVRVVAGADRALDTGQVIERIDALGGHRYTGNSIGATVRRDLTQREAVAYAGQPRVLSTHVKGRCLYYPSQMPRRIAVARYLEHSPGTA